MKIKEYIVKNKILIIVCAFFLVMSFGAFTFLYTIGVDSEYAIFIENSATYRWIAQGRFGIGLTKLIFNTNQILPFRNTIIALFCIAFNCLIICKIFGKLSEKENKFANIIFCVIYVTLPISAHYMYFTTYNFEVSLAMILVTISIYYINNIILLKEYVFNKYIDILVSVLLLALAISFYQSMITVYISLVIVCLVLYLINNKINVYNFKEIIKIILKYVVLLIISFSIYFLIDKILSCFVIKEAYTSGFIGWKNSSYKSIIKELFEYLKKIYINDGIYGFFIVKPTLVLSLILGIYYIIKAKKNKIMILFLMVVLNLVPMFISILLGTCMPYRTQQAFLIVIPSIWYIACIVIKNFKIRNIFLILAIFVGFRQSMYINKLFYSNYLRYQYDINLSNQISDRIQELNIPNKNEYPVVYLGKVESPKIPNIIKQEVIGYSVYEWDNGNYVRIQALMTMSGENNKLVYYLEKDNETLNKAHELAKDMPSWPSKESIALKDNLIIVKLSED